MENKNVKTTLLKCTDKVHNLIGWLQPFIVIAFILATLVHVQVESTMCTL